MAWLRMALMLVRNIVCDRGDLALENLALRQQLAVLHGKKKRPKIRQVDRIFWSWLSCLWSNWRSVLVIVQPETAVRWHQQGFRLYWRWMSRARKVGRPKIDAEIRKLIRRMSRANPLWGTPRIRSELRLLGYDASKATYGGQVQNPPLQAAVADVANFPGQPCS